MSARAFVVALLMSVTAFGGVSAAPLVPDPMTVLPVRVADEAWRPLSATTDPQLQVRLEKALARRPEWQRLIANRKMAVSIVDLSKPSRPRSAWVNGNEMMYAASLPKIAILMAAFDRAEQGRMTFTPEIEKDLEAMIRVSSNGAATRMIDRLGGLAQVNAVLVDPRFRLYDTRHNGGLWVGKRYAQTGPRLPDPLKGISHGATVNQVSRFYYQLATGRLINYAASAGMLRMLADPAIEHKFVKTLHSRAPAARLYRKSGTWRQYHADSVLVWGPEWRRYILVAIVESENGEKILRGLVDTAEGLLKPGKQTQNDAEG